MAQTDKKSMDNALENERKRQEAWRELDVQLARLRVALSRISPRRIWHAVKTRNMGRQL